MATEKTARPFAGHWRALRILSILSIIGGIFEILLGLTGFIGFGFAQATASPEELAEILSVSEHSAAIFVYMGLGRSRTTSPSSPTPSSPRSWPPSRPSAPSGPCLRAR